MRILDQLWYGHVAPGEQVVRPGSEYAWQLKNMVQCEAALNGALPEDTKAAFAAYVDAARAASGCSALESFASGFRLGALLMLDVLGEGAGQ